MDMDYLSIYFLFALWIDSMTANRPALKWGVKRRLAFIEFRLFWEGRVNRSDIIDQFDVSVPQASKDFSLYQELAPENARYNKSEKCYVANTPFTPIFLSKDPDDYLSRLRLLADNVIEESKSWIAQVPDVDVGITPRRKMDTRVLRAVLDAIHSMCSLRIFYQSMSPERPDPIWREIEPHAFGHDGFRWHIRAYCCETSEFRDFLLPRILKVSSGSKAAANRQDDTLWHDKVPIKIAPHPDLAPSQQAIVAKDYGMKNGKTTLRVRYAMLFYLLKRLNLLDDASKRPARTQHIVAVNPDDLRAALKKANFSL